jgi:hypothetical protein
MEVCYSLTELVLNRFFLIYSREGGLNFKKPFKGERAIKVLEPLV